VVVYTDDHDGSFGTLAPQRAEALMWVWRHRYAELGEREDIDYVFIFENRGVEVGVTLHHPHGQIYGYPFLPPVPALELAADARLGGCAPLHAA
jgi:UDPglucose--hexose-1-phosphate uridylyltransferase